MGMPRARAGKVRPTSAADLATHRTLQAPIVKPRNRLPLSPMKTRAGWKLKSRKPHRLPSRASMKRTMIVSPLRTAKIAMTPQVMAQIAGRQAVEPIAEVDGVRHPDDPENCQQTAPAAQVYHPLVRQGDTRDADARQA